MGFWTGLFIGWIWGTGSVVLALCIVRRARDVTFNHNHFD